MVTGKGGGEERDTVLYTNQWTEKVFYDATKERSVQGISMASLPGRCYRNTQVPGEIVDEGLRSDRDSVREEVVNL